MSLAPVVERVQAGALSLRCCIWGRAGDPTVVLVHGNGGHAHWWAPLLPALVPGWRVVAPDLRGHGESAWAEPPSYRLDDFADDLAVVTAALAPGVVPVIGHSMGGRVALAYTARHPAAVRALGLLDSRLSGVAREIVMRWRGRLDGQRQGRGYPSRAAAEAGFRFVPPEPSVPADVVALLASHAVHERGPDDWTFRFDRAVLARDGDGTGELYHLLREVRCPTFVGAGAESWVLDAAERARIAAMLPQAAIEVFPGAHHFLVAHPERTGTALRRFLDALP